MIVVTVGDVIEEPPPPNPPSNPRRGLTLLLTGVDGSLWYLCGGDVSVPELTEDQLLDANAWAMAGIIGLGDGAVEHKWRGGTVLDGAVWEAMRHIPREVTLPVELKGVTSTQWRILDDAWSEAIAPEGQCKLTVTLPNANWRTLTMRQDGTSDGEGYDGDPMRERSVDYTCKFIAADPYWRGAAVSRSFTAEEQPTFFSPPGSPHVVTIGTGTDVSGATMRNPGQIPAWPVYTVTGPCAGFRVGVGNALIRYGAVGANHKVIINTSPSKQTVLNEDGNDVWSGVTGRKFAPIKPGAEVDIDVLLTAPGAGAGVTVALTPGYRRAW